jgi:hypothetical protein
MRFVEEIVSFKPAQKKNENSEVLISFNEGSKRASFRHQIRFDVRPRPFPSPLFLCSKVFLHASEHGGRGEAVQLLDMLQPEEQSMRGEFYAFASLPYSGVF